AGASQGPSARRRAGPPARYRRGRHRRRFPPADLHRPAARTPPALPQAGRRSRLRDVWRRRPRDRRQGHPAGAGAGRLRAARSRPDGGDAEGQRPRRGRRDRALDGAVDRQPGLHEDGVLGNHELYRSIGKPNAATATSNRPPADRTGLTDPVTMIRTLDARELGADEVVRRLARPPAALDPSIQRVVDEILADVRARGDAAVLEYTERFDGHAAPSASALAIAPAEWDAADRALASDV